MRLGETPASLRVTASWRPCLSLTKWTGFLLPSLTLMTIFYEEVFLVLKVQVGIQVESISSHGEQRVWRMEFNGPRYRTVHCLGNVYFLVCFYLYLILYVSVYSMSPESFVIFKLLLLLLFTFEWSVWNFTLKTITWSELFCTII